MTSAGSISGSIRISAKQAIAEYAALRAANATTRTALLASSAAFTKVGVGALAAAAPIALLFKAAISSAAQFQKKIDYFGAVTGATQDEMDAVAQKAKDMARTTVYSADDMADAMVEFGKAGIKTKDILGGVLDATVNLAQAADISVGDAANIMAAQLSTFNLKAKDAAHVADELAGAANASIIDISDLAYSLKYAGGIAATTGISFNSVVTALSLLGKRGIRGSQAGTSLRMIMISLLGTTKAATTALQDLGIITKDGSNKFVDAHGHIKDLSKDMQILQNAEKGLTDAQQLQINKTIFNTRALSALQILMRQGTKGFRDMRKEIGNVTAADVAHKRLDNLAGDWTRLKNNIKTTLIEVGGPLQNFFRMIVQGLTHLIQGFSSLSKSQQKYIIYGLGILGLFLTLVGVLALMISAVLRVIYVFGELRKAFVLLRGVLLGDWLLGFFTKGGGFTTLRLQAMYFGDAIKRLLVRLGLMTAATEEQTAANAGLIISEEGVAAAAGEADVAMAANPIGLIVIAVLAFIAALVLLIIYFKQVANFLHGPWGTAISFGLLAFNPLLGLAALFIGHWKGIVGFFKGLWHDIASIFTNIYHAVVDPIVAIIDFIRAHIKIILAIILWPYTQAVIIIATIWKLIGGTITKAVLGIWHFLQSAWRVIVSVIRVAMRVILTIIRTIWHTIKTVVSTVVHAILTVVRAVWNAIKTASRVVWSGIKAVILPIVHAIANTIVRVFNAIKGPVTAVWHAIGGVIKTVWNTVIKPIVDLIVSAINSIKVAMDLLIGAWTAAWDAIGSALQSIYDHTIGPIINTIKGALGTLKGLLSGIGDVAGGIGSTISGALHAGGDFNPLNWDQGGWVPGRKGQPVRGTVHGGEYVLSADMLRGNQVIDPRVMQSLSAAQSRAMVGYGNVGMSRNHAAVGRTSMQNGTHQKLRVTSGSLEIGRDSTGELRAWVQDIIAEEQEFQAGLAGMG